MENEEFKAGAQRLKRFFPRDFYQVCYAVTLVN
jgi:hypothetical protein